MQTNTETPTELTEAERKHIQQAQEAANLIRRMRGGGYTFYWIAAFSVINTVILLTGGGSYFVIGLGVTQIIDSLGIYLASSAPQSALLIRGAAISLDLVAVGLMVFFGYSAAKGKLWGFLVGAMLYGLDALLVLYYKDYLAFGFHLLMLWSVVSGYLAARTMQKASAPQANAFDFPTNIGN